MSAEADPEAFMASVAALLRRPHPRLTGLQAGILVALHHGIARDSRSFARRLGIAHALALRATAESEALGLLAVVQRDARTQRSAVTLTEAGLALLEDTGALPDTFYAACGGLATPPAAAGHLVDSPDSDDAEPASGPRHAFCGVAAH